MSLAAFAFRDVVSTLEIKCTDDIFAPHNSALALESMAHMLNPNLLAECLGDF